MATKNEINPLSSYFSPLASNTKKIKKNKRGIKSKISNHLPKSCPTEPHHHPIYQHHGRRRPHPDHTGQRSV